MWPALQSDIKYCSQCGTALAIGERQRETLPGIKYAGFWIRVVASILDSILVSVINVIVAFSFVFLFFYDVSDEELEAVGFFMGIVVSWLYYGLATIELSSLYTISNL